MSRSAAFSLPRLVPLLVAVVSCTQGDRGTQRWPEESPPVFSVSLPDAIGTVIAVDSVRRVPAPPVEFAATVEPDRDHTLPLLVSGESESKTVMLAPSSSLRRGDTLALLRRTGSLETPWAALAPIDGWWRPRRYAGESVWPGDTLGMVQITGWYRATGRVEEGGRSPASPGDSARIVLPGHRGAAVPGVVASVTTNGYGGTDLSVHFQASSDTFLLSSILRVSVVPRESVLVVPADAIVSLSLGPALFLPRSPGVYDVRFIVVDPHARIGSVVHGGLEGPVAVATSRLDLLLRAAEESLSASRGRSR